jgi:hypothetical protein
MQGSMTQTQQHCGESYAVLRRKTGSEVKLTVLPKESSALAHWLALRVEGAGNSTEEALAQFH